MKTSSTFSITPKGDREIVMTRAFDAPRTLVWEALTKPEHLKKWFGVFGGIQLVVCEVDLRTGGKYRHVWRGPDGMEMGMRGEYREVAKPERIVSTEQFDQSWYPGSAVGTMVLTEKGGRTTLTTTVRYDSKEARDIVLKSPMESGVKAGYDNLEKFLETMAQEAK